MEKCRTVNRFTDVQGKGDSALPNSRNRLYVDKIVPNVGDTLRADELWIKVDGNMKYLFALARAKLKLKSGAFIRSVEIYLTILQK